MFDHPILVRQFDRVIVTIDPERRKWAPHACPCSGGTEGVVIGFYDAVFYTPRFGNFGRKPGVYHKRGAAIVWLPDGQKYRTGTSELELVDKDESRRRLAEFRALQKSDPDWDNKTYTFIGDLPELRFWEGDLVYSHRHGNATVQSLNYHYIDQKRNDGSPMPPYQIDLLLGGTSSVNEDELILVSRGNVWKYYHGKPPSFDSLEAEAAFYIGIGRTEEVRNPANGYYDWTKDEALAAIRDGLGHAIRVSRVLNLGPKTCVYRFVDEEVGKRLARATLEGFGVAV